MSAVTVQFATTMKFEVATRIAVTCQALEGQILTANSMCNFDSRQMEVNLLDASAHYYVRMAAVTILGEGVFSLPVVAASLLTPLPDNHVEVCESCAIGTYKDATGNQACTLCPLNTVSAIASGQLVDCKCRAGYTGPDGGSCAVCQASEYKSTNGSHTCQTCPPNSGHALTAQTALAACACNAGYTGTGGSCDACLASQYKPTSGPAACTSCPANSGHALAAQAETAACLCNPGYTGSNGGPCEACPVSTYKSDPGSAACAACPGNSTSLPSSTNVTDCLCDPGFGGPPGGPCALCAAGTYELQHVPRQLRLCAWCYRRRFVPLPPRLLRPARRPLPAVRARELQRVKPAHLHGVRGQLQHHVCAETEPEQPSRTASRCSGSAGR
jgi:hypothetical protein